MAENSKTVEHTWFTFDTMVANNTQAKPRKSEQVRTETQNLQKVTFPMFNFHLFCLFAQCFLRTVMAWLHLSGHYDFGKVGFSAARFSVPCFPFMFFLCTVFHFAVFPVA